MNYTPENITSLAPDEVFVFGSNLQGLHAGGAARVAYQKFGAVMGHGVGMQGQSYAIPTMHGGIKDIKPYVDDFIELAREWDQTTFYVTRIGCGIAGFKDEDIAPLFDEAYDLYNVRLPESFARIIERRRADAGR
jgi:O-acetyl-ADP-ribose deacetylase (regulator of RNase III)